MKPHLVVDIGNTRLKWGLVDPDNAKLLATESLPDDVPAWQRTIEGWHRLPRSGSRQVRSPGSSPVSTPEELNASAPGSRHVATCFSTSVTTVSSRCASTSSIPTA